LTFPSCTGQIENSQELLPYFDGIIVHSSSFAFLKENYIAKTFYHCCVEEDSFSNEKIKMHKVGAIAVSGGHRNLEKSLFQKIFAPHSLGSSYTIFPEFVGEQNLGNFNNWLRSSIQNSQEDDNVKGSSLRETIFGHKLKLY